MQVAAAGVLAQAPRSLINGGRLERDIKAPFDAVFQTITRPDEFMARRKSVAEVVATNSEENCFSVKEIFMGAQAEFEICVYPYYDKCLIHHSGKAEYFCVDASIDYTLVLIDECNTRVIMEYSFVMPSLLASFAKNIIAKDRKSQLEAIAENAEEKFDAKVTTPDASCEFPPLNTDRTSGPKKKDKKKKTSEEKKKRDAKEVKNNQNGHQINLLESSTSSSSTGDSKIATDIQITEKTTSAAVIKQQSCDEQSNN